MKQEKAKILDANKEILTTDEAAVFLGNVFYSNFLSNHNSYLSGVNSTVNVFYSNFLSNHNCHHAGLQIN